LLFSFAVAWSQQPIAFNHKTHAAAGIKCLDCHAIRLPGDAAGIPSASTCMGCHASVKRDSPEIQKLNDFAKKQTPVPWNRVYRLPKTVYFSHEIHHRKAKIECAECHGPVAEREVITKEKSIAMKDCMACHDRLKASNDCALCHDSY
jgi:hypothetical protein